VFYLISQVSLAHIITPHQSESITALIIHKVVQRRVYGVVGTLMAFLF